MRLGSGKRFSAVLTPSGVHCVEYRRGRRGLRVVRYRRDPTPESDPRAAVARLVALLEEEGARGGRVALGVAGFRTCHHILALPPAPEEVLQPVVTRELRRLYPDLFARADDPPAIDFVPLDPSPAAEGEGPREFLASAAPRRLGALLREALREHEVTLEHLTALPQCLQRIYRVFGPGSDPAVLLLMVPRSPLLGFFRDGALRLFSESVRGHEAAEAQGLDGVVEQIERGVLFLRQQFRGAAVETLLFAAEAGSAPTLVREIEDRLSLSLAPMPSYPDKPGVLIALGAALDASSDRPLALLEERHRPLSGTERAVRTLAGASAAVLIGLAGWWVWSGFESVERAEARLRAAEARVSAPPPGWSDVREVVRERQAHAQRASMLGLLRHEHGTLPGLVWALQDAPPAVRIENVAVRREDDGWQGTIRGSSASYSSAVAAEGVSALFAQLRDRFPGAELNLTHYGDDPAPAAPEEPPPAPGGVAISFAISFIVPQAAAEAP